MGTSANNSLAESFTAAPKREALQDDTCWADAAACRREVCRWLVGYNTKRKHSYCRYLSPADYEKTNTLATLPEAVCPEIPCPLHGVKGHVAGSTYIESPATLLVN